MKDKRLLSIEEIEGSLPFSMKELSVRGADDLRKALRNWQLAPKSTLKATHPPPRAASITLPPSAPFLLSFAGAPRSGKDILAKEIFITFEGVNLLALSSPIIQEVNRWLSLFGEEIDDENKSEPQLRHLLQSWAQARRELKKDWWIKSFKKVLQQSIASYPLTIVTGVRLEEEVKMIKDFGGETWRIVRKDNPYISEHPLEHALDHLKLREIHNQVEGEITPFIKEALSILSLD